MLNMLDFGFKSIEHFGGKLIFSNSDWIYVIKLTGNPDEFRFMSLNEFCIKFLELTEQGEGFKTYLERVVDNSTSVVVKI